MSTLTTSYKDPQDEKLEDAPSPPALFDDVRRSEVQKMLLKLDIRCAIHARLIA